MVYEFVRESGPLEQVPLKDGHSCSSSWLLGLSIPNVVTRKGQTCCCLPKNNVRLNILVPNYFLGQTVLQLFEFSLLTFQTMFEHLCNLACTCSACIWLWHITSWAVAHFFWLPGARTVLIRAFHRATHCVCVCVFAWVCPLARGFTQEFAACVHGYLCDWCIYGCVCVRVCALGGAAPWKFVLAPLQFFWNPISSILQFPNPRCGD